MPDAHGRRGARVGQDGAAAGGQVQVVLQRAAATRSTSTSGHDKVMPVTRDAAQAAPRRHGAQAAAGHGHAHVDVDEHRRATCTASTRACCKLEELVTKISDLIENRIEKQPQGRLAMLLVDLPAGRVGVARATSSRCRRSTSRSRRPCWQGKNLEIEDGVDDLLELINEYALEPALVRGARTSRPSCASTTADSCTARCSTAPRTRWTPSRSASARALGRLPLRRAALLRRRRASCHRRTSVD